MFIIFGVFLFRDVSKSELQFFKNLSEEQKNLLGTRAISAVRAENNTYSAWVNVGGISDAGEKFAQNIFTATITLLTAVTSFYFAQRGNSNDKEKPPSPNNNLGAGSASATSNVPVEPDKAKNMTSSPPAEASKTPDSSKPGTSEAPEKSDS